VNHGVQNEAGEPCPLGQQLAELMCRDLLGSSDARLPLDDAAEMARFRVGQKAVNDYLFRLFSRFAPGTSHLALVQLPWDSVYTTNYDLLVETAAKAASIVPAGVFRPIFSLLTDLSVFSEPDILYYKLHGSIDFANTEEGRLILTKEDYRYYERSRKPLFKRLKSDLLNHTLIFVGYSLGDSNFRAILEDCREELGTTHFPRSFAIRKGATELERTFWQEKYNIETINMDGSDFLLLLKDTWITQNRSVIPFDARSTQHYMPIDEGTRFEKVGESFYRVRPHECSTKSDPPRFFNGGEPSWGDIAARVPPLRDHYYSLLDGLFEELINPELAGSVFAVTGAAGTGKTTLIRSLAYDLATDTDCIVLIHIPGTPFDAKRIAPLHNAAKPVRIVVIVHSVSECLKAFDIFVGDIKRLKLPVSFVLEDRKNLWNMALSATRVLFSVSEVELGGLSDPEIQRILDALAKHNALGKLTGASREQQESHFEAIAQKELLVALRELTNPLGRFDEIIRHEYETIPSAVAKQAYVYVSALGQLDLPIRFETLQHVLNVKLEEFGPLILQPTEGVLLSLEDYGRSRHNAGFRVKARHPVIASVIFAAAAADDDAKFKIINSLVGELDPGYPEDARLLEGITRRKALVGTLGSPHMRRAVYDRLEQLLPGNAYVLQHRSILERDLGNAEQAVAYARRAFAKDVRNPAFLNTLGFALEYAARTAPPIQHDALLAEASKHFDAGLRLNRFDAYAYLGKAAVIRHNVDRASTLSKRRDLQAELLSLLEDAFEATKEDPLIAGELAKQRDALGSREDAISIVKDALAKKPADERLRNLWVRLERERGNVDEALKIAIEGEKHDPTAWRIQRSIAQLKRSLGHAPEAIVGYYEAALRHNQGDPDLLAEYGAFLFMTGKYSEATVVFEKGRQLKNPTAEKTSIRYEWRESSGKRQVFSGKVKEIRGGVGVAIAVPDNFTVMFWRTRGWLADLRENDSVQFTVGFSAQGPRAEIRSR
jgi:Flp pilus assembly protein TadD